MRIFLSFLAVTAVVAAATRASADTLQLRPSVYDDVTTLTPSDPTVPTPVRRAPPSTDDPYAPLGISAGGLILYPSIALGIGGTTNASGSAGGTAGGFWSVTPVLDIRSNWDTNSASLLVQGSYRDYFNDVAFAEPTGSADGSVHLDLADQWSLDLGAGANYAEQSLSDPNYPAGADKPPGVIGLNGSAALNGNFGRVKLTLAGGIERTIYENATSGGVPVDQSDRTNTLYSGRVRLGYEVNPTLTPFVETEIGRRLYDKPIDDESIRRAGTSYAVRAGVEINRDPLLKGEIAVGAVRETFDDPSLSDLQALTLDGSLTWSPRRLLTVTLAGNTGLSPTTNTASSGSVLYSGSLDVAYAWRRNATFDWISSVTNEDYQGTGEVDTTYRTGLSATWKLNREMQLVASYAHEWLVSSDPSLPYQSDTVQAELKFLR
jgi:hypothetical protein